MIACLGLIGYCIYCIRCLLQIDCRLTELKMCQVRIQFAIRPAKGRPNWPTIDEANTGIRIFAYPVSHVLPLHHLLMSIRLMLCIER